MSAKGEHKLPVISSTADLKEAQQMIISLPTEKILVTQQFYLMINVLQMEMVIKMTICNPSQNIVVLAGCRKQHIFRNVGDSSKWKQRSFRTGASWKISTFEVPAREIQYPKNCLGKHNMCYINRITHIQGYSVSLPVLLMVRFIMLIKRPTLVKSTSFSLSYFPIWLFPLTLTFYLGSTTRIMKSYPLWSSPQWWLL